MQAPSLIPCSSLRAGDLLQFVSNGGGCLVLCDPMAVHNGLLARMRRESTREVFTLLVRPAVRLHVIDRRPVEEGFRHDAAAVLFAQAAKIPAPTSQPS